MAADGGADAVDLHTAFQIWKPPFHQFRYLARILQTTGMGNIAPLRITQSMIRILFHLVNNRLDHPFLGAYLFPWDQLALHADIQKRADAQQTADGAGGFGNTAAFDVEGQVR